MCHLIGSAQLRPSAHHTEAINQTFDVNTDIVNDLESALSEVEEHTNRLESLISILRSETQDVATSILARLRQGATIDELLRTTTSSGHGTLVPT